MSLDLTWALQQSDAKAPGWPAPGVDTEQAQRALAAHYGDGRLRAMLEFASLARSPRDGWRAAVQAVRDGDPTLCLE